MLWYSFYFDYEFYFCVFDFFIELLLYNFFAFLVLFTSSLFTANAEVFHIYIYEYFLCFYYYIKI